MEKGGGEKVYTREGQTTDVGQLGASELPLTKLAWAAIAVPTPLCLYYGSIIAAVYLFYDRWSFYQDLCLENEIDTTYNHV